MSKKTVTCFLSLFLTLCLLIGCGGAGGNAPAASSVPEAASSAAAAESVKNEEPKEESEAAKSEEPAEKNGDVIILYTSDVHCGIDQGFGYAGLKAVRDSLENQGYTTLLVDNGDAIQGEVVGSMTKGEAIINLMNDLKYDVAIPGNHEFDYGMDRFLELTGMAEYPYISCNFNFKGEPVFDPYLIKEAAGVKIAFVGVTTPETVKSSTPKYFQDETGAFVYDFCQDETGAKLYAKIQEAADAARAEGADYVYLLAHCGLVDACRPWTYADIISNTTGIDVVLDGHSHDSEQVVMKNKTGEEVIRSACGTKLQSIGWSLITKDGKITAGLYNWPNETAAPALLGIKNEIGDAVDAANKSLDESLDEKAGSSEVELTINDPVEKDANGKPIRMVRRAETNLGDLSADAIRAATGAEIALINGGGIRVSIPSGDITKREILAVNPFGNILCEVEATGQQILDALEWGARAIPGETGAFLQVSGLTYEVHSAIESPCITDENSMLAGFKEGERRVQNVMVGGEPLDPAKTYTVGGTDYVLLNNGDGNTALSGVTVLRENITADYQALMDYITETLGGSVGSDYADLYGQGRIKIIE